MRDLLRKWNSISLVKRIIVGMVIGAILGVVAPKAVAIGMLGTLFVGGLKAIAPVLVKNSSALSRFTQALAQSF